MTSNEAVALLCFRPAGQFRLPSTHAFLGVVLNSPHSEERNHVKPLAPQGCYERFHRRAPAVHSCTVCTATGARFFESGRAALLEPSKRGASRWMTAGSSGAPRKLCGTTRLLTLPRAYRQIRTFFFIATMAPNDYDDELDEDDDEEEESDEEVAVKKKRGGKKWKVRSENNPSWDRSTGR